MAMHSRNSKRKIEVLEFLEQDRLPIPSSLKVDSEDDEDSDVCNSDSDHDEDVQDPVREKLSKTPGIFTDVGNADGWKIVDVAALVLYLAKSTGVADSALNKFLKLFALVADTPRHRHDEHAKFPCSVHRLHSLLKIDAQSDQQIYYICPATTSGRRRGEQDKVEARCGFRLRRMEECCNYKCPACGSIWDRKVLGKDGNHVVTIPLSQVLTSTLRRFGQFVSPLATTSENNPSEIMNDVLRAREMGLERNDIAILLHSDGAVINKSTAKKLYLTFLQCPNIPLNIRANHWTLVSVWVGADWELPKDRECFLLELSKQLKPGNPTHDPIQWTNKEKEHVSSDAYVVAYLADTPERTSLNGQLSHSAGQGCLYCLQIAECMSHRMCFKYDPTAELKTHAQVLQQTEQWEADDQRTRKARLKQRETQGFKRPSLINNWAKFDAIKVPVHAYILPYVGFCIDCMHAVDEGVAKFLLEMLVEKDSILNTWRELAKMDRLYLQIAVTGNSNRNVRSLRHYKYFKAHELRFFLQHAAPYVTKDFVPKKFYKTICLASRLAFQCTKDNISAADVLELKSLCDRFMTAFQSSFGVEHMKYSIHLMSHLWYAVELYGPLQIVSCYGPEDHIGKITRKVKGRNNITKHIMNAAVMLNKSTELLHTMSLEGGDRDYRVLQAMCCVQGLPRGHYISHGLDGTCRLTGKAIVLGAEDLALMDLINSFAESTFQLRQCFLFRRAAAETGIFLRAGEDDHATCRNESIVMDDQGVVLRITHIIGVLSEGLSKVVATFVCGRQMVQKTVTDMPTVGTRSVLVPHIFAVSSSDTFIIRKTASIYRQLVVLFHDETHGTALVSPPSNRFRPT
ncbi:hypothetical protein BV898_18638 [Hypsibius exemplaris]|uniref:Uncharacterized protein n=1 Tax=Hypsibius exemplaris TaxID=2072580 RepID=A0A9X6NI57_HYPEX|nr:hypothetical protein BV898_18638 [Hypsibius exemplaris]